MLAATIARSVLREAQTTYHCRQAHHLVARPPLRCPAPANTDRAGLRAARESAGRGAAKSSTRIADRSSPGPHRGRPRCRHHRHPSHRSSHLLSPGMESARCQQAVISLASITTLQRFRSASGRCRCRRPAAGGGRHRPGRPSETQSVMSRAGCSGPARP